MPPEYQDLRGGAHLLGGMGWNVWKLNLKSPVLQEKAKYHLDFLNDLSVHDATLQVNWAEHLPFAVVRVAVPIEGNEREKIHSLHNLAQVLDEFFDDLPGRLSPNNQRPRTRHRWVLAIKVKESTMAALRDSAGMGDAVPDSSKFRRLMRAVWPNSGAQAGPLLVDSPYGNVMTVQGEGILTIDDREAGEAFDAFLFSRGNLASREEFRPGYLPFWIPDDLRPPSWLDFQFWPFVHCANMLAQWTLIESGRVEEVLYKVIAEFESIAGRAESERVAHWPRIRSQLLKLLGRLESLRMDLHMSESRSQVRFTQHEGAPRKPDVIRIPAVNDGWFWGMGEVGHGTMAMEKTAFETQARRLLDSHLNRIHSLLEAIAADSSSSQNFPASRP